MGDHLYLERFFWFDHEVRLGSYPNCSRLKERFEISIKTAQRHVDHFRDRLMVPLEYDTTRKGYYYTDPDFQLPIMRISEGELLALLISRKLITEASAGSLAEELESVSSRLGTLLAVSLPGKTSPEEAFSFRWKNMNPTEPATFKTVTSALLQGRELRFSYYSPATGNTTTRTVQPHHMVNYMGSWYLIAFCALRNDWRNFVLGRMSDCRATEKTFLIHDREEWLPYLRNTFGIFQNRQSFRVVLRFSPERSRWVRSEVWHEDQKVEMQEDGSLVMTLPAPHEAEIMMEILKHGSHVEVLEPAWLREKTVEEIRLALRRYEPR